MRCLWQERNCDFCNEGMLSKGWLARRKTELIESI